MIPMKEQKLGGGFREYLNPPSKKIKNLVGPDSQA
jgi:hypothetical protein